LITAPPITVAHIYLINKIEYPGKRRRNLRKSKSGGKLILISDIYYGNCIISGPIN
jgi:hypothetical protein